MTAYKGDFIFINGILDNITWMALTLSGGTNIDRMTVLMPRPKSVMLVERLSDFSCKIGTPN